MVGAYCTDCGEALVEGKSFCAGCGTPVQQDGSESVRPAAVAPAAPVVSGGSSRRMWIVGAVVVAVIAIGAAIGMAVMAQNRAAEQATAARVASVAELKKAYDGMVVVKSATSIGVTYSDYGSRVRDAAAALAVYTPTDDQAKVIAARLSKALDYYKIANDAWATKFETYPYTAYSDFKDTQLELADSYSADDALQAMWAKASVEMEAAKTGLDAYTQSVGK